MTKQQIDALKQNLLNLITSNLANESSITALEHRTLENAIVDAIFTDKSLIGDIKEIACNQQYINDNFVPSSNFQEEGLALPSSERFGWAICNGKNGTINKMGRVAIGYDPNNYQLGSVAGGNTGGVKDVQLSINQMPTHSHDFMIRRDSTSNGNFLTLANTTNSDEGTFDTYPGGDSTTSDLTIKNKGGNGTHTNMQPYIVTLFIQKIS